MANVRRSAEITLAITIILVASIVALRIAKNPISNVSAIGTVGVGVYWDHACAQKATSITWGELFPGQFRGFVVYVRNEGANITYLDVTSANWIPTNASLYLSFKWNCTTAKILPTQVVKITTTLTVSPNIQGIKTFSFNINFQSLAAAPKWDVNRDGKVNLVDLIVVTNALNTTPTSPNWNSHADLNADQKVNLMDLIIVMNHLNQNYT